MAERAHALYLPPPSRGAAATPNRRTLEYIESVAPALRQQVGVAIEVYALRLKDAANLRVTTAFHRRGVSSLPALLAGGRTYFGGREIENYYSRRLSRGGDPQVGRGGNPQVGRGGGPQMGYSQVGRPALDADPETFANESAEEALNDYMRSEMGGGGRLGSGIDVSGLGDDD